MAVFGRVHWSCNSVLLFGKHVSRALKGVSSLFYFVLLFSSLFLAVFFLLTSFLCDGTGIGVGVGVDCFFHMEHSAIICGRGACAHDGTFKARFAGSAECMRAGTKTLAGLHGVRT